MSTDYEQFYKENPHGLGEPFRKFADFFENYKKTNARVLDLGCGQGRDALFIARKGHSVLGVDIAETGIKQMLSDAKKESLNIKGVVKNIKEYMPDEYFDVVVIDRTLHMLPEESDRIGVLENLVDFVKKDGYVLIADEKSNLPAIREFFVKAGWTVSLSHKGFLFVNK
ncbi:class I SAM-dependent methyltransferase [Candidatus Kaiserbacteria bacterium]|nr:class I SAM-dependent methyltransferase [Candidatus Kaiserbacteria bacterium]